MTPEDKNFLAQIQTANQQADANLDELVKVVGYAECQVTLARVGVVMQKAEGEKFLILRCAISGLSASMTRVMEEDETWKTR